MAIQRLSFSGHEPEDPIHAEEPLNLLITLNASYIPPLTVMLASLLHTNPGKHALPLMCFAPFVLQTQLSVFYHF